MIFAPGKTYHQEFGNGDRVYFRATEQCKNGRWRGLLSDLPAGGRPRKAKSYTADPTLPSWIETPDREIPKTLAA